MGERTDAAKLAAYHDIERLVGAVAGPTEVVDRVALLAQAHEGEGVPPVRQVRAPEGVSPLASFGDLIERESAARSAPTVTFEPVAEAFDRRGGENSTLYDCSECGALVVDMAKDVHARWHERVGVWTADDE